jgi:hypothetical protein
MEKKFYSTEEIDAILNSIDTIKQAEMPPFFSTRLQARLQTSNTISFWEKIAFSKPAFTVAMLVIFLVLNIATINTVVSDDTVIDKTATTSQDPSIQSFAQDYNLSVATIYQNEEKSSQ